MSAETEATNYTWVCATTCTVNGYRYREDSPAWQGLDMARAELREQSIWGQDHHLRVPWWHPEDGPPPDPPQMYYRVRPRIKSRRFVHTGTRWTLEHRRS